jgi:hypothetical protein
MKKDEAKKALEQLNIPEQKTKRNTRVEHDYAALSATTFRNKKGSRTLAFASLRERTNNT